MSMEKITTTSSLAGHHREGNASERSQPGGVQRGGHDASKPEIKKAVEELFSVKVKAVNTPEPQGQGEALPWTSAAARLMSRRQSSRLKMVSPST
jgi:hypothetical protein